MVNILRKRNPDQKEGIMTKMHFIAIAEEFASQKRYIEAGPESPVALTILESTVRRQARLFKGFNPAFDDRRFIKASGF